MNIDFDRTIGLIGEDSFINIQKKKIAVIGLGGVGGTALEALARTGFQDFFLMDFDEVSAHNLNRQILFTTEDIGKPKVECAKKRLETINVSIKVSCLNKKFSSENIEELQSYSPDFVVDCIDDIAAKVELISFCVNNKIPFISSLGMANKFDPSMVQIKKLNQTTDDPLARKLRHDLKALDIDLKEVNVVASLEKPLSFEGKLNSIITVPSSAGLNIAYFVLSHFTK